VDAEPVELRVLGCLIEKQRTTPETYPLSLNSLRLACNQSTNRDPVVDYDEPTVRAALDRLGRRKWTTLASWSTARAVKYKHLLDQALGLDDAQLALLTVLMLRGPQTAGELRQRSERIHRFDAGDEVERTLDGLLGRELAVALPRQPGERGQRYAHLLAEAEAEAEVEATESAEPAAPDPPAAAAGDGLAARVERLEGEVEALREQLSSLREELGA